MKLVDKIEDSLVEEVTTIKELKDAKDYAEVYKLVFGKDISLKDVISATRIQHKETRQSPKKFLHYALQTRQWKKDLWEAIVARGP